MIGILEAKRKTLPEAVSEKVRQILSFQSIQVIRCLFRGRRLIE